jgi:catechol O-methyltransferase
MLTAAGARMATGQQQDTSTATAAAQPAPRGTGLMRWSLLRMLFGWRRLLRDWQVGDGREEAVAGHVLAHALPGDLGAAVRAIDDFAYRRKFLINVGDEKGAILEAAVARAAPRLALELGAYVGYSALRIARALPPGGRLVTVEINAGNAAIARRIVEHAGAADRVAVVDGALGDGGATMARLARDHGLHPGAVDLVFIDHAKDQYLPDLRRLLDAGWLHPGTVVIADNLGFPGAPAYRDFMDAAEGTRWRTQRHAAHVEYQSLLRDVVFESTLLAPGEAGQGT